MDQKALTNKKQHATLISQ